ncbi:MAG: hypothetical protein DCC75_12595 [Proteobacteria bacterium]|nr:MAG: hypothetical protein DCC75_12595 [Pseudomonadota bacterium]
MSFKLTGEQREFQDSLRKFLSTEFPLKLVRERYDGKSARQDEIWRQLKAFGLLETFGQPKEAGGAGISELCIVAYETGFNLLPAALTEFALCGPYLVSTILGSDESGVLEKVSGSSIDQLKSGQVAATVAWSGAAPEVSKGGGLLTGICRFCPEADRASVLIRLSPQQAYLCRISPGTAKLQQVELLDRSITYFEVDLKDCEAVALSKASSRQLYLTLMALKACEMAGICEQVCHMTFEYLKTRKQFGVPVGGFQAVQHRAADMWLQSQALLSIAFFAGWAAHASPQQLELAALAAAAYAAENGCEVVEAGLQLHGGIGFTWEYDLHLYLRRARVLKVLLGSDPALGADLISAAASL